MYFLVLLAALLACTAGVPLNITKPTLDGRIFGGNETDITSHPYQVSLRGWNEHTCGGSIISPNWVVTSSLCSSISSSVRSGSTYSNTGGSTHDITRIIVHEGFNASNFDYDVALVQVSPAFTFSASVQPITLECNPVPVGTEVVVTGWGYTSEVLEFSTTLQQATLQIANDSECNSTYAAWGSVTDHMICAEVPNGDKGACWGDWGGPLVASNRLVGILSVGQKCDYLDISDLYIKLSAVCDWIVTNAGLYKISAVIN